MKGSMPTPGAIQLMQSRIWHDATVAAIAYAERLVVAESSRLGSVVGLKVTIGEEHFPSQWVSKFFLEELRNTGWEVTPLEGGGFEIAYPLKEEIGKEVVIDYSSLDARINQIKSSL
jgi:hypothetical protein